MLVKTKYFGEIDLSEDKIIQFDEGIMGFEEYKTYTLLYDIESKNQSNISWLQSIEMPDLAIPVINPFLVKDDYNPVVEDEVIKSLGDITEENLVVFLSMTVPKDITKMTVNLKAPFVINSQTRKGCQIIVENADYPVKFGLYEVLQERKQNKGGKESC